MKTNKIKEEIEFEYPNDERYLNKEFPKGETKFRGQAMVLLALAREQGKEQATADFIKMIEKLNLSKYNWTVDEFITELLKELK